MAVKTLLIEYDDADGDVIGGYPLSAPAVEAVRCRDCVEWCERSEWSTALMRELCVVECIRFGMTNPNGFCAWGERREEE